MTAERLAAQLALAEHEFHPRLQRIADLSGSVEIGIDIGFRKAAERGGIEARQFAFQFERSLLRELQPTTCGQRTAAGSQTDGFDADFRLRVCCLCVELETVHGVGQRRLDFLGCESFVMGC